MKMIMEANYVVFKNPRNVNNTVDYVAGPFNFYCDAIEAIDKVKDDYHEDNQKLLVVVSAGVMVTEI